MSKSINIKEYGHNWEKSNLITQKDYKGFYDAMFCTYCNMKGKRRNFTDVEVRKNTNLEKLLNCPNQPKTEKAKKVMIKNVTAFNPAFNNLTAGSIHNVIPAPAGEKEDNRGVWVMGIGEPVKVLNNEFNFYTENN